jgi:hypothetical protein
MASGRPRNSVRRRFAAVVGSVKNVFARLHPPAQEYSSQRMCPFCGLITPRSKRLCLECGKSLRGVDLERKDAKQG